MRHKALHRNGFTLIELTIAISIATLVAGASLAAWFQLATTRARSSDYMTAYGQVQNAGYWFSRDAVQLNEEPDIVSPPPAEFQSLTLQWDAGWPSTHHTVVYTLISGELRRTEGATSVVIARYIDSNPSSTNCTWSDGVLALKVTAEVGEPTVRTATRTYKVEPRVPIP